VTIGRIDVLARFQFRKPGIDFVCRQMQASRLVFLPNCQGLFGADEGAIRAAAVMK
jgi:hypothetical protein